MTERPTNYEYAAMRPLFDHPPNIIAIREALGIMVTEENVTIYTREEDEEPISPDKLIELNQMGEQ